MKSLTVTTEGDGECDCDFITIKSPTGLVAVSILDGSCVSQERRINDTRELISILSAQVATWEAEGP